MAARNAGGASSLRTIRAGTIAVVPILRRSWPAANAQVVRYIELVRLVGFRLGPLRAMTPLLKAGAFLSRCWRDADRMTRRDHSRSAGEGTRLRDGRGRCVWPRTVAGATACRRGRLLLQERTSVWKFGEPGGEEKTCSAGSICARAAVCCSAAAPRDSARRCAPAMPVVKCAVRGRETQQRPSSRLITDPPRPPPAIS